MKAFRYFVTKSQIQSPHLIPQIFCCIFPWNIRNTECERHKHIFLFSFLSNLVQYFVDMPVGAILRSIVIHCCISTNKYSILNFHSSNFFHWISWSLSLNWWAFPFHHKNRFHRSPTVIRFITCLSKTLSEKGVSLNSKLFW